MWNTMLVGLSSKEKTSTKINIDKKKIKLKMYIVKKIKNTEFYSYFLQFFNA